MLFAKLCVFLCLFSIKEDLFRCNLILKFDARFQHIFVRKCIFSFIWNLLLLVVNCSDERLDMNFQLKTIHPFGVYCMCAQFLCLHKE